MRSETTIDSLEFDCIECGESITGDPIYHKTSSIGPTMVNSAGFGPCAGFGPYCSAECHDTEVEKLKLTR